jgi:hypothetical protein
VLPGRTFSALQLVCILYAGFKRIEPEMGVEVDLGEEWGMCGEAERSGMGVDFNIIPRSSQLRTLYR